MVSDEAQNPSRHASPVHRRLAFEPTTFAWARRVVGSHGCFPTRDAIGQEKLGSSPHGNSWMCFHIESSNDSKVAASAAKGMIYIRIRR